MHKPLCASLIGPPWSSFRWIAAPQSGTASDQASSRAKLQTCAVLFCCSQHCSILLFFSWLSVSHCAHRHHVGALLGCELRHTADQGGSDRATTPQCAGLQVHACCARVLHVYVLTADVDPWRRSCASVLNRAAVTSRRSALYADATTPPFAHIRPPVCVLCTLLTCCHV